jgi:2-hydroxy-6-oxonona-2,4-dienedioate hydrolase
MIAANLPFWLASRYAPDSVRRFVLATPPDEYMAASAGERDRADRMMREILPISARRPGLLHDTLATQNVPRPRFESIRAPTLVISARDDGFGTFASAAYAAERIPGARFLAFERGGHLLLGHQAEVVAAVEALSRNASGEGFAASPTPGGKPSL